ncbi:M15 family metallopeptidase [Nakamurella sp. GG22]
MNRRRFLALTCTAAGLLVSGCSITAPTGTTDAAVQAFACAGTGAVPGWTTEQVGNARAIAQVALGLGLGERGALVGITVAITESTLVAVNYGDYRSDGTMTTSRGLFQQMDHWGPLHDRLDPAKSAELFYTGGADGSPGLVDIPGWESMPVPQAAQAVERSQFADGRNYARNLQAATALTKVVTTTCTPVAGSGGAVSPAGLTQNSSQDPSTFGWVRAANQVPYSWRGHSFGRVAAGTPPLWDGFLTELVPQIPGGLNNYLGGFENRNNVNSPGMVSFHAYGLALDINFDRNPNGADPASLSGQYVIPAGAARTAAARWGMEWGGDWSGTPDPMHFEIHVTPQQIAALPQRSAQS